MNTAFNPKSTPQKRVVVEIVQHLQPGGLEHLAIDLVQFAPAHVETYIISLEGTRQESENNWARLKDVSDRLIFLDKQPGLKPHIIRDLVRILRQLKPDAVHTHHLGPLIYGGLAARLCGVRSVVHTEHNAWHLENSKRRHLMYWFNRLVRPKIICDAKAVKNAFQKFFPTTQADVILNGVDTERFRPGPKHQMRDLLGLPKSVPLVGCVARLVEVKGHSYLIEAMCHLPGTHLALAGDGPLMPALKQQAQSLGLTDRVHFLGHIDQTQQFYQCLDVFCLPSLNEGLPLAPLEAQACGVPSVLTSVGACAEAAAPGISKLVPPQNSRALSAAIQICLLSEKETPRPFVVQHASVVSMAHKYSLVY